MNITIYAKRRTSREGKKFIVYVTRMTKKDGTTVGVKVKFNEDCPQPKPDQCPMNIVVDKEHANMSQQVYDREDTGEQAIAYTLWVNQWTEGEKFVDHSLDEFE